MRDLTQRQKEILDFIAQFTDDNGFAPTVREVCDYFNISIRAVQDHVAALQKKNALIVTKHKSRSMIVVEEFKSKKVRPAVAEIPIIKSGDANDLLDPSNVSGAVYKASSYIRSDKTYFATHVADSAMKSLGILEGDLLVAEKTEMYSDGSLVVAYYEGKFIVRKLKHQDSKAYLKPESKKFPPIYSQFKILGVVVEVSRNF